MQPMLPILPDPIIETRRAPIVREEYHRYRLAEIIELQTAGADCGHYGGVGDGADGDVEGTGAQNEVRVCCCAEGVADYEEGYVEGLGGGEDGVAGGFDHFAVGEDNGAAVEGFLGGGC